MLLELILWKVKSISKSLKNNSKDPAHFAKLGKPNQALKNFLSHT